jgi:hypothetical protein
VRDFFGILISDVSAGKPFLIYFLLILIYNILSFIFISINILIGWLMTTQKIGNPAVVGLAGFGMTTLILQFHNLGLCSLGPVLAMGLIFGGLAQMIAGFQIFTLFYFIISSRMKEAIWKEG